jgi:hypothetical protein
MYSAIFSLVRSFGEFRGNRLKDLGWIIFDASLQNAYEIMRQKHPRTIEREREREREREK